MDKDLIKKFKLEESVKRFQQINEYTFITSPTLSEDDDNNDNDFQNAQGGGQGDDNAKNPQQDMQGGDNGMNNPNANAQGGPMSQPPMDNSNPNGNMQNGMDGTAPMGNDSMPPIGTAVDDGNGDANDDFDVETVEMEEGDEVIDVDDLTNSQKATEYKVDDLGTSLGRLLKVVNKFVDAIDQNDRKIEDLKAEFEKRMPTPEEKLNIRSQSSYPYSETPKDYWDKKTEENPNYNVMYDNDVPANKEQEKFEIRQKDIDNINYREIADSFDKPLRMDDYLSF